MGETQKDILNRLFKEYELVYDQDNPDSKNNDVFKHRHYTIITRAGIQKIEKKAGIIVSLNAVESACGKDYFTIQANGTMIKDGKPVNYETFASASPETSTNKYYPEMAEKRARSRIILTLAGLYEQGVFGQDEADEFNSVVSEKASVPTAKYKGG